MHQTIVNNFEIFHDVNNDTLSAVIPQHKCYFIVLKRLCNLYEAIMNVQVHPCVPYIYTYRDIKIFNSIWPHY